MQNDHFTPPSLRIITILIVVYIAKSLGAKVLKQGLALKIVDSDPTSLLDGLTFLVLNDLRDLI